MAKITEFKMGKGFTSRPSDAEEWTKKYLEITVKLPEAFPPEKLAEAVAEADELLGHLLGQPLTKAMAPLITMEEIEALPWVRSPWVKKSDPDRKAKPGEDAWIKRTECDTRLEALISDAPNQKFEDYPPYSFSFAGEDKTLVVRKVKREKAK